MRLLGKRPPRQTRWNSPGLLPTKNYAEADRLLSQFMLTKNEVNALRFYTQVFYWMKENERADAAYQQAIALYPDIHVSRLDYDRMLQT